MNNRNRGPEKGAILALSLLLFCFLLVGSCVYTADQPDIQGRDLRLTILHTSDIHSRILPFHHVPMYSEEKLGMDPRRESYGGIARVAYVIKRERKKAGRSLHLDSGDLFQGAPIFNLFRGEVEIRTMSLTGLNAFALGNHEFDAGATNVARQFEAWADFPVLAANYEWEKQSHPEAEAFNNLVKPFTVFNLYGLKVGVIGMGNLSSMTSLEDGGNSSGILPLDTLQTVQDNVNMLRQSVDLVVLLSHLGLNHDNEVARNVCGLDLILGGHHHIALNPPKVIPYDPDPKYADDLENIGFCQEDWKRDTLLVHSQAFAKFVGRLDLVVRDGRIRSHQFELIPVDDSVPDDPEVWEVLETYYEKMLREYDLDRVIAHARVDLRRFGSSGGDSMLGNFVAEAMQFRKGVETDFCVTNSLGMRTDIQQGEIDLETMFNVLPFDNTITTMYLSGVEVQQLLDYASDRSAIRGCSSQIQVSGVTFRMNCATGKAEDIRIRGEQIEPDAVYELATNNYMAWGGSGFDVLKRNTTKIDTGISMRDAVIDYMKKYPELPLCEEPFDRGPEDFQTEEEYLTALEEYMGSCQGIAAEDGRIKAVY